MNDVHGRQVGVSGTKLPPMAGERHVSPLAGFGVGARGDRLYRLLLRSGGAALDELSTQLGWTKDELSAEVGALLDLELVTLEGDKVSTAAPHLALNRLVEREAATLFEQERQLDSLRAAIRDYAAEERADFDGPDVLEPLEVHAGGAVGQVVNTLIRTTAGPLMMIHPEEWFADPGWSKRDSLVPIETRGGRPTRGIYPSAILHQPEPLKLVRTYAEIGEEIRLMPRPPSRLLIFGDEAVMVPVEWGRRPLRRIVLRAPGVVDAFVLLFELLWRSAVPFTGEAVSASETPDQARADILRLLAAGAKDETIARQLGMSLRTVRRRVAELLAELGGSTRFQAGVEAVRRGDV